MVKHIKLFLIYFCILSTCIYIASAATYEKIAFVSERDGNKEIYIMNPDGSEQTRLTNDPALDYGPAWLPDGTKIVFVSDRDGNFEIYVMDVDGSNQQRITNTSASESYPAWSPDGLKIVFGSSRDGNWEIYSMNADGTGQTRLTNDSANDQIPSYSPDGTKIVFVRGGSSGNISLMNPGGSNLTILTGGHYPSYSPDGTKIVFFSSNNINTINSDGSGQIILNATGTQPSYSPDGTKIVFINGSIGGSISLMNPDGSGQINITDQSFPNTDPAWSPPICAENWTIQYDNCLINDTKLKYYIDENSCGTVNDLPADNGTYIRCDTLLAYWNFNENSGTIVADTSGNENNGTINGAIWISGINDSALEFDGIDDYINVPDSATLDLGTGNFTISVWIKANSPEINDQCVFDKDLVGTPSGIIRMSTSDDYSGKIMFDTGSDGGEGTKLYSETSLNAGEWYYVVVRRENSSYDMWINGKYDSSIPENTFGPLDNNQPLIIGGRNDFKATVFFNGSIDELKFYNYAISGSEILAEYNANKPICTENWTDQYGSCLLNDTKLKYYIDGNSCGTIDTLPADNGTYEVCDYCTPDWTLNNTWGECQPINFQFKNYYDSNSCNEGTPPAPINQSCDFTYINGSTDLTGDYSGILTVQFKQGTKLIAEYEYNFTNNTIDLTNVTVDTQGVGAVKGYLIVSGVKQEGTKTLYIDRINTNMNWICIKDTEISNISEITSNCKGANEYHVQCNNQTSSGYRCEDLGGNVYRITGLQHSGIIQADTPTYDPPPSGGGGGGPSPKPPIIEEEIECNPEFICGSWSACRDGEQIRNCVNECGETSIGMKTCELKTEKIKPEEKTVQIIKASDKEDKKDLDLKVIGVIITSFIAVSGLITFMYFLKWRR
jgi:hypothetical protein